MKCMSWWHRIGAFVVFSDFQTSSRSFAFVEKLCFRRPAKAFVGSQRYIPQQRHSWPFQYYSTMASVASSNIEERSAAPIRPQMCSKCLGEGKIYKPPSRKARLRHKRKIEAINSSKDDSTAADIQPLKRREEPCSYCFQQSGLIWKECESHKQAANASSEAAIPQSCTNQDDLPSSTPVNTQKNVPLHVAIIGGGIGGLALAAALLHRGISCQVFEKDLSFHERSQGYGLTLQQARRALRSLGIRDNPSEASDSFFRGDAVTSTKHVVHTTDGTVVGEWGLRKWGKPGNGTQNCKDDNGKERKQPKRQNLHVPRQTLRFALLEAVHAACGISPTEIRVDRHNEESVPISWGHKLTKIEKVVAADHQGNRSKMLLSFNAKDQNGLGAGVVKKEADLVVGCDGIRSSVRELLFDSSGSSSDRKLPATPLRYLDCIVILGICRLDSLEPSVRKSTALLDGETVFQTADGNTRIYLMPYSARKKEYMWQLSFPVSEDVAKEWSRKGSGALKHEALNKCGFWHEPIPEILRNTPTDCVSGYPVYDRDLLTVSDLASSRSCTSIVGTLLGDACHPMSPFKGQGANQALLDALSLARSIYRLNFLEEKPLETALGSFEEEMIQRSSRKVIASSQAAQFLHSDIAISSGNVTRGAAAAAVAKAIIEGRSG